MGIQGLLPLLKSIQKPTHLKNFKGKTLAVDAYGWLHRGIVACAIELATEKPTRKFVDFAMHRVRMLIHFGVTPYIIFDGDYLPSKAATEADRRNRRETSKKLGLELLKAGKPSQAHAELQKAIDVTPDMARQLIDELKKAGIQYIVAPYEADAQMVYLERKGIVDGILSEDSDILVFGAECLLTKLDQYGACIEINKSDFTACKEVTLTGWTDREFRHMAILSGCDYLASINNMGLKTAYRMVRKYKTIEKVIRMLQFDGKYHVPKTYLDSFYQAELTFLHQRVYCPRLKSLVYHTEPKFPLDEDKTKFIGPNIDPATAQRIASGELNPMTKLPIHTSLSVLPRARSSTPQPARLRNATDGNLKKVGPLNGFFKAKRVPLAEMDVNLFTPPPTHQGGSASTDGAYQDENAIVHPGIYRPATVPHLTRTVPQPLRTALGRSSLPTVRDPNTEPRPQKRSRLCDDDSDIAVTSERSGTKMSDRSRFFEDTLPDPSPSINRKLRRGKQDDINIFSDDSIEEALLNIPDDNYILRQPDVCGKSIIIFKDSLQYQQSKSTGEATIKTTKESSTATQIERMTSEFGTSSGPTCIPFAQNASDTPETPCADNKIPVLHTSLTGITSKFSFTPQENQTTGIQTPPTTGDSNRSHIPLAKKAGANVLSSLGSKSAAYNKTKRFTPLQSIASNALISSRGVLNSNVNRRQKTIFHTTYGSFKLSEGTENILPNTPPYTPDPQYSRNGAIERNITPRSPSVAISVDTPSNIKQAQLGRLASREIAKGRSSYMNIFVASEDVPLPLGDDQERVALKSGGSEDAIIRDSDGDDEFSDLGESYSPTSVSGLNLESRFLFTGS